MKRVARRLGPIKYPGNEWQYAALLDGLWSTGKPCQRCGAAIVKLKVGGRGTLSVLGVNDNVKNHWYYRRHCLWKVNCCCIDQASRLSGH
nr:zinc finger domain-containing protein [Streptococcus equi]